MKRNELPPAAFSFEELLTVCEQVQRDLEAGDWRAVLLDIVALTESHVAKHERCGEKLVTVESGLRVFLSCLRVEPQD